MHLSAWLGAPDTILIRPMSGVVRTTWRALTRLCGRSRDRAVSVPPVSSEWLAEHDAEASKHADHAGLR